jgi:hypothetical protein
MEVYGTFCPFVGFDPTPKLFPPRLSGYHRAPRAQLPVRHQYGPEGCAAAPGAAGISAHLDKRQDVRPCKAVEINVLWYNALRLIERWLKEEGQEDTARQIGEMADRVRDSFNQLFWYEQGSYLSL